MSVTIEGLEKAQDVSYDGTYLQHIPAKIDYEGPANVKNFFTNFTSQNEKESNTPLFNAFRGRPLNGRIVHLPKNYSAWVIQSANRNSSNVSEDETKSVKYVPMARTNKITVWNYDKEGDLDNPLSRALQWTEICDALAVSEDEDDEKENSG